MQVGNTSTNKTTGASDNHKRPLVSHQLCGLLLPEMQSSSRFASALRQKDDLLHFGKQPTSIN